MNTGKAVLMGALIVGAAIAFPMADSGRYEFQIAGTSNEIAIFDTVSGKAWWCPKAKHSRSCEPYKYPKKHEWNSR